MTLPCPTSSSISRKQQHSMNEQRYDGGLIEAATFFQFAALVALLLAVYRKRQTVVARNVVTVESERWAA